MNTERIEKNSCEVPEMREIRESTIKGLVHTAMAGLALVEAADTKIAGRRVLNGLSAVYHALCAVYHFRYEDEILPLTDSVPRSKV